MMKKVEIEIPEGKKAEWVNGVLTLVDDKPEDIKERIKTFEDAVMILVNDNQAVIDYFAISRTCCADDIFAFAKLRVIAEALNEGWKPTFDKDERLYYPWFNFYSKDEWDKLDEGIKGECHGPLQSVNNTYVAGEYVYDNCVGSYSNAYDGVRLAFKTKELAEYCGKQFIDIWTDFLFA